MTLFIFIADSKHRTRVQKQHTYVLKLDQVFPKSVYGKPSIPWDTSDYHLSHYVTCTFRLHRPPLTFKH